MSNSHRRGDRRAKLLDRLARRWRDAPPPGFVCAAGITDSAPAVARLMRCVSALPQGMVVLADATHEAWRERGRLTIPSHSKPKVKNASNVWTHPVVANGRLYLRDQDLLFCYEVSESGLTRR